MAFWAINSEESNATVGAGSAWEGNTERVLTLSKTPTIIANKCVLICLIDFGKYVNFITKTVFLSA